METVSTGLLAKNKEHYLRSKDKAEKAYDVSRHIRLHMSKYKKKWRFTIHYVKPTAQQLFKSQFSKSASTYRRQVVNPRHQTLQGQSVSKPETPLQSIQAEQLDVTWRGPMAPCWIRYSEIRSRGKYILGNWNLVQILFAVISSNHAIKSQFCTGHTTAEMYHLIT